MATDISCRWTLNNNQSIKNKDLLQYLCKVKQFIKDNNFLFSNSELTHLYMRISTKIKTTKPEKRKDILAVTLYMEIFSFEVPLLSF